MVGWDPPLFSVCPVCVCLSVRQAFNVIIHAPSNPFPKPTTLHPKTGARVLLLLARAGQQPCPTRITPLKDLAGLPTLEFRVHKRSLQTDGPDYVREVDALASLLKEGLPADSPLAVVQGGGSGSGPLALPLPPLEAFLFEDVAHVVP